MTGTHRFRAWPVVVVVAALAVGLTADTKAAVAASPETEAVEAAERFLDRYVAADGRVQRLDQGGDTVSEGQGYAMLVAVAVDEPARFDRIWSWTRDHLQRSDGLLAWHWVDGAVVDPEPAADADLAAASALALAGERWSSNAYLTNARGIAAAVLEHEAVATTTGAALAAGPWAVPERIVNPSYLMPTEMARLRWLTGDEAWAGAAATARALLSDLTASAPRLPADWSAVGDAPTDAVPTPSPSGDSPRYGFEATRALVTFAVDCDPIGRQIAASAWPFFLDELEAGHRIRAVYDLDGQPLADYEHPTALVAAAAAADAAGAGAAAAGLLDRADELDAEHPSYYGAAWLALGRLWLDTDRLGGCPP